jgi:hypothetical protein
MANGDRSLEQRVRQTLKRRGYRLEKSRRRDPLALDYGRYWVWNEYHNTVVGTIPCIKPSSNPSNGSVTLDEIAQWLDRQAEATQVSVGVRDSNGAERGVTGAELRNGNAYISVPYRQTVGQACFPVAALLQIPLLHHG